MDHGLPFFTIGHSNRSIDVFTELLGEVDTRILADIRAVPRSRANPPFNMDTLAHSLAGSGISYEHMAALGGLRSKARALSPEVNGFWTNESFHSYTDDALSDPFPGRVLSTCSRWGRHGLAPSCGRRRYGGVWSTDAEWMFSAHP